MYWDECTQRQGKKKKKGGLFAQLRLDPNILEQCYHQLCEIKLMRHS